MVELKATKSEPNMSIPEHFYMMRHPYRSAPLPTGSPPEERSFNRVRSVQALDSHSATKCVGGDGCAGRWLNPTSEALLWQYKDNYTDPELAERNGDCPIYDDSLRIFQTIKII